MSTASISGLGFVGSIGQDVGAFTRSLRAGTTGIARREPCPDKSAVKIAAEIRDFDFDAAIARHATSGVVANARRLGARASLAMQTTLCAVLEAWTSAGLAASRPPRHRIAVVVAGSNLAQGESFRAHARHAEDPTFVTPRFALQFLDTNYVGVISEMLGTGGDSFTVGGASASGNVALVRALDLVATDRCDVCLVVAPAADLSEVELQAFHNSGALAKKHAETPERACRPFDRDHDGFVYGRASACIVLASRAAATSRRSAILAELRGGAVCVDGNASANPNVAGEIRAMREAMRLAGVHATDVDYVNAHGSSSTLGDQTEVTALREVFGARAGEVFVNSTKGLTGHCLFAAGVVEAVATVVQMRGGFVHPSANLENPIDPACRFAPSQAVDADIRCALSNSFGFGGINTSIVISKGEG